MTQPAIAKPSEQSSVPQLPAFWVRVTTEAEFRHSDRRVKLPASVSRGDLAINNLDMAIHIAEQRLTPANGKQRRAELIAMLALFPQNSGADNEGDDEIRAQAQQMRFEHYHKALQDIPADILKAACEDCVKTLKWFPMPAAIIERCSAQMAQRRTTLLRLRALKTYKDADCEEDAEISPEERRARAQALRESLKPAADEEALEPDAPRATVRLSSEPEVSSLATAILRARMAASGIEDASRARIQDIDFLKKAAIADARWAWTWMKVRGWKAPEQEESSE